MLWREKRISEQRNLINCKNNVLGVSFIWLVIKRLDNRGKVCGLGFVDAGRIWKRGGVSKTRCKYVPVT